MGGAREGRSSSALEGWLGEAAAAWAARRSGAGARLEEAVDQRWCRASAADGLRRKEGGGGGGWLAEGSHRRR